MTTQSAIRPADGQFPCKDGFVFFGSYSDKLWRDTCASFGELELADDPEIDTMVNRFDDATYKRRIEPLIERWFMPLSKAELEALACDRIALTPIKKIDEVVGDPPTRTRDVRAGVRGRQRDRGVRIAAKALA